MDNKCMLSRTSMAVWADGTYGLCCFFDKKHELKNSILETFNGTEYETYRAMQEVGYPIEACRNCISKYNYDSTPKQYSEKTIGVSNTCVTSMEYLHYSLSNICNLACRTCCNSNSTKYGIAYDGINKVTKPVSNSSIISDLNEIIPSLKHFTFHGGEPLLSDNVFQICDILNKNKNISIQMITNCTNYNKLEYFLKYMNGFRKMEIMFSIDGDLELSKIIRPFGNYTKNYVNEILSMSKEHNTCNIVHSTISNMNILFLEDLVDLINDNAEYIDNFDTYVLAHPVKYHISNLPNKLKSYYCDVVRKRILGNIDNYKLRHRKAIYELIVKIDNEINRDFSNVLWYDFKLDCKYKDEVVGLSLADKILKKTRVDIYEL